MQYGFVHFHRARPRVGQVNFLLIGRVILVFGVDWPGYGLSFFYMPCWVLIKLSNHGT